MSLRDLCAGSYRTVAEKYRAIVIIVLGDTNERAVLRRADSESTPIDFREVRERLSKETTNSGAAAGERNKRQ